MLIAIKCAEIKGACSFACGKAIGAPQEMTLLLLLLLEAVTGSHQPMHHAHWEDVLPWARREAGGFGEEPAVDLHGFPR